MLYFKKYLPFLLLCSFSHTGLVIANTPMLSDEQMTLLETLPPDQRDGIMAKMQTAQGLQDEIEETFDLENSMIIKPELEELNEDEICEDCIFGYDFFKFSPTTFAPVSSSPISSDYILGPGDKLLINFYGNDDTETEAFISREGFIVLPEIGPLNMTGLTFQEATDYIKKQVELKLIGIDVSVSLSELRSISVYMLGEAYKPGKYTLSGLSGVTNALFISGGVNENGSLRNIKVKRDNKVIQNFDFYDFLLNGSTSSEISLQDGDIIFIPFIENIVRVGGAFKRPHTYEFKEGETIQDAINFAGGFTSQVQPKAKIELNSIDNNLFERKITNLPINSDLSKKLHNEDVINISSVSSVVAQTITLKGEVEFPGDYSILEGDTLLDIIDRAGGYTEESFTEGAVYIREEVKDQQKSGFERSADELEDVMISVISNMEGQITEFSLAPIGRLVTRLREEKPVGRFVVDVDYLTLKTDPLKNFRVREGDSLFIPKRPNTVSVVGEVLNASSQSYDPKFGAQDYIDLSGGFKEVSDDDRVFIIGPNGKSSLVRRSLFSANNSILPGSTIVVPRNPRPLDGVALTQIITPILADLATSAAAIAAISD
jgi:protein involved in polysaccharide export with SLBB domain